MSIMIPRPPTTVAPPPLSHSLLGSLIGLVSSHALLSCRSLSGPLIIGLDIIKGVESIPCQKGNIC